jgi:hypothetical protein
MAAKLAATVYVPDPDTHQTAELAEGTLPESRLAALVTNPAAWVDGKLPRLPKPQEAGKTGNDGPDPTGDGPDGASGDASDADSDSPGEPDAEEQAAQAAKKTAAKKTAATGRSRGRAAAEGDSGE